MIEQAHIADEARIEGKATISGHAKLEDSVRIKDKAIVTEHANLKGRATIQDKANIKGYALIGVFQSSTPLSIKRKTFNPTLTQVSTSLTSVAVKTP